MSIATYLPVIQAEHSVFPAFSSELAYEEKWIKEEDEPAHPRRYNVLHLFSTIELLYMHLFGILDTILL